MSKHMLMAATLLAAAAASSANAQSLKAGASLMGVATRGEFHSQIDRAFGIGGFASYAVDRKGALAMRVDGAWLNHGWEARNVDIISPLGGKRDAELMTSNDILLLQVGPELSASVGKVRPYAGAHAGVAYFLTNISAERYELDYDFMTSVDHHDAVFAYGAQAGVRIPAVSKWKLSLDFGAEYQRSDKASFLPKGSVDVDGEGRISMAPERGRADYVAFRLGVSLPVRRTRADLR